MAALIFFRYLTNANVLRLKLNIPKQISFLINIIRFLFSIELNTFPEDKRISKIAGLCNF